MGTYSFVVNVKNKGLARINSTVTSLYFPLQISAISPTSTGTGGDNAPSFFFFV